MNTKIQKQNHRAIKRFVYDIYLHDVLTMKGVYAGLMVISYYSLSWSVENHQDPNIARASKRILSLVESGRLNRRKRG